MLKKLMLMMALGLMFGMSGTAIAGSNPCNPCSWNKMKHNPCSMNPCDMKKHHKMNPCSMNPCDMKKHQKMNPCNPCGMKKHQKMNPCNPCSMNPCSMGDDAKKKIRSGSFKSFQQAATAGKKMWQDEALGKSGLACLSCHAGYSSLNLDKRQNYPHYVAMVDDVVTLDQMINYCMLNPMQGEQFEPNSKEMTALAAYFRAYRMKYLRDNK